MNEMKINQDNLDLYWHWIKERQNILYRRFILKEQPPWTEDKILQDWKFCNVERQNDTGTKYLKEEIIDKEIIPTELLFKMIVYRLFNRIETYEKCLKNLSWINFNLEETLEKLKSHRIAGNPVFTNAFMVTGKCHPETHDKIEKYFLVTCDIHKIIPDLLQELNKNGLEGFFQKIKTIHGIGNFIAYVICSDLVYTRLVDTNDDNNTWVYFGAGAKRGLKLIFPDIDDNDDRQLKESLQWLYDNQEIDFREPCWQETKKISLMNIENCCCELSKYFKIKFGKGRAKVRFNYK